MDEQRIKSAFSETLVLSLLKSRPMHGYELCTEVAERSGGVFSFKHSTLYPLLHRLEKGGLIAGTWSDPALGRPRKTYGLTRAGKAALRKHAQGWRGLLAAVVRFVPEAVP